MLVKRTGIVLSPNNRRVVLRPFELPSDDRKLRIIARVSTLSEDEVDAQLSHVFEEFHGRHQRPREFFLSRYEAIRHYLLTDAPLTESRQLLLGAYFTQEYALESAALFNPSIVWHPDQSNLAAGSRRFVLSLRAVGEGHISSVTFRSGVIDGNNRISIDEPTKFVTTPEFVPDALYEKDLFLRKLIELELGNPFTEYVLASLDNEFTLDQLENSLKSGLREHRSRHHDLAPIVEQVVTLAKSNYEITYLPEHELSERLIFPFGPTETNGIEDARFRAVSRGKWHRRVTTPPTPRMTEKWCCPNCSRRETSSISKCTRSMDQRSPTRGSRCSPERSTDIMPCCLGKTASICT